MYGRTVNDTTLTFGVSGYLLNGGLVMFDRQTGSMWVQASGLALSGPFRGARLQQLAAHQHVAWAEWVKRYPRTLVLSVDGETDLPRDAYAGWHQSETTGPFLTGAIDARLPAKVWVLGVQVEGQRRAYPLTRFTDRPFLEDTLAGHPLLLTGNSERGAFAVFSRRLDDRTLTFDSTPEGILRDRDTGTTWDPVTGEATGGALAGQRLQSRLHHILYWFAWVTTFPETEVYAPPGDPD